MKKAIAIATALFMMGNAMAQQLDTLPQQNFANDTMPVPDTAKKWSQPNMQPPLQTDTGMQTKPVAAPAANLPQPMQDTAINKAGAGEKNNAAADTAANQQITDRVMMKDGQMMLVKNGMETKMEKDVTLPSGTVISTAGVVKKKDGSEVQLKDGQYIALPAAIEKKPAVKEKKAGKPSPKKKG